MKKIFLILFLFLIGLRGFAVEIVYPKSKTVTINSPKTFFIGNSDKDFTINGQKAERNSKGAFAYVVELHTGENIFEIDDGVEKQIFKITRPEPATETYNTPAQNTFTDCKAFMTSRDHVPLRSTPVDAGINRLSHLPLGVVLTVTGEKNGFYKVFLCENEFAWISKNDVIALKTNAPANLKGYDYIDDNEYFTFVFHIDKKVPFIIEEGTVMKLKLYNIEGYSPYIMEFPYSEAAGCDTLYGYGGEFIGNDFVWKIRKPLNINKKHPLKNIKIAVDAGHGGDELGAISCFGDKEKDINLSTAKFLQKELEKRGAKVYMTRTEDTYLGLRERVDKANEAGAVILLSIHGNALPDNLDPNTHRGTSIYYYYDMAKPLAESIIAEMTCELGLNNDKVRQGSLALVRNTNALGILIEVGYLINPDNSVLLRNEDFQKSAAKAIADGIENFLAK